MTEDIRPGNLVDEYHPDKPRADEDPLADGTLTLVYAARDTEHNNAVALKRYLEARL